MQLGQFSASVSVDGVPLPEFVTEYSADGTEATCWIPSETDKNFRVEWTNNRTSPTCLISGRISVDGIECAGKLMHVEKHNPALSKGYRDSVASSATARRPLMFSKQALTDDDKYLNVAISPHLGTIRLQLCHVRRNQRPSTWHQSVKDLKPNILHEKSKKAVGHSVQFGADFPSKRNTTLDTTVLKQLVTFVFKYRPIGLLLAQGIAPLPPNNDWAPDVLDLTVDADDDEAEIQKLEARLGALKNKRKRVKREPSSDRVKKEMKTASGSRPIFNPGEVIDLT